MRQRLGLAQALLGHPRVLILDEPTSGLDPALRREFYAIVAARAAEGATVLLASHALTELEGRADRVVIVDRGAKIADGTLDDLRRIARLPVHVTRAARRRLRGRGLAPARRRQLRDQVDPAEQDAACSPACSPTPAPSPTSPSPSRRSTTSMPTSCSARPRDDRDSRHRSARRPPRRCPCRQLVTLAGKEIREGFRNRWVLATTLLLADPRAHPRAPRQRADRHRRAPAASTW